MTTIKHNFSTMMGEDNPLWGVMLEVNNATNHFLAYTLITAIFIIATYVFMRKTNDIAKSLISATHISVILTILLFYAGKSEGVVFVSDVFMLGLMVMEVLAIGGWYYMRHSKNQ